MPDQQNSDTDKGIVCAATSTYWLRESIVTLKRFYSVLL